MLALNIKAVSATFLAIGPAMLSTFQPNLRECWGTMPGDARRPTTPHMAAGMRNEPPTSVPVQSGNMSVANAAAEPPDEPPAFSAGLNGLPVAPQTMLRVLAPAPISGVLVLVATMAPAAFKRATMVLSILGTWCVKAVLPKVVSKPAVSVKSLTPMGKPCSAPRLSPRITAASAALAASRARSKSVAHSALTPGLTVCICSM